MLKWRVTLRADAFTAAVLVDAENERHAKAKARAKFNLYAPSVKVEVQPV